MPYSVPAQRPFLPLAAVPDDPDPPPTTRNHRRSSSNARFSSEKSGPGAFAPMNNLPRRKSRPVSPPRPMFQFHPDSSSSDDDDDRPPSTHIPLALDVRPTPPGIPFPSRGPTSPPLQSSPLPLTSSPLPPTPSASTVRLANGKPLRPSLKSSLSSPHLPSHLRSQSAPTSPNISPDDEPTPPTPKNVHFKEDAGLASVRLFHIAGKPVSISREDETETETEGYDSGPNAAAPPARFPFPTVALALAPPPASSPIPMPPPAPPAPAPHILLASLALADAPDDDRAPTLAGTLLVRNVAYEKHVAVRFTLDDWRTTSEVAATYQRPGALPPAFPPAAGAAYDTFAFRVALHGPPARVLLLAARLNAAGGEWWDNNAGANYRVAFRAAPPPPPRRPLLGRSLSSPAAAPTHAHARGTGFSSYALPPAPAGPPPPPYARARLTLRNYAPPQPAPSPLPTPPASREPSFGDLALVGGHPATVAAKEEDKDTYAALLARWCFATSEAEAEPKPRALEGDAPWRAVGWV